MCLVSENEWVCSVSESVCSVSECVCLVRECVCLVSENECVCSVRECVCLACESKWVRFVSESEWVRSVSECECLCLVSEYECLCLVSEYERLVTESDLWVSVCVQWVRERVVVGREGGGVKIRRCRRRWRVGRGLRRMKNRRLGRRGIRKRLWLVKSVRIVVSILHRCSSLIARH